MRSKFKKTFFISLFLSTIIFISSLAGISRAAHAEEDITANLFPNAIYKDFKQENVTRGIVHIDFEVFDSQGWLKGDILTVDLEDSNVGFDLLYPGSITAIASPEKMAKDAGAVAVVNGDFFDIGKTNAPIGAMVRDGELLKSSQFRGQAIGISTDNIGSIFHFIMSGLVTNTSNYETPRLVLGGINEHTIVPNQLFMYTPAWGSRSRASLVSKQPLYAEVVVKNNTVVEVLENRLYSGPWEEDMYLLLGVAGAAQIVLEGYAPGDILDISMNFSVNPENYKMILGGDVHLVVDGEPQKFPTNPYRHPRTAMGFSRDGKTMYLAVVDGRQKDSRGMSYDEMAQFMASLGAWTAINLDSGGSTQMLTRPLAEREIKVANSPSDGRQRSIPNAVGLFSNAPAGQPLGFKIETISNRIFTGLTRSFKASPYDEYYNPTTIEGGYVWATDDPAFGIFESEGIIRGGQKGSGNIVVSASSAQSSYPVKVLGSPVKIFTDLENIYLPKGNSKTFRVYGLSEDDYHALIESRDINIVYDNTLLDVVPQGDNSYKITSKMDHGTALVEIHAGGLKTWIGVAAGYESIPVTGFDGLEAWIFEKYPEEVAGAVNPVIQPVISGMALRLDYNFARTDVTRAAYMVPKSGFLPLPDGTQKLGLQVFGSAGNGHWLRGVVKDSKGSRYTIDFAKEVNWEGWKYVEATIPSEVQYPIGLEKIYLVSTDPSNLTAGCIVIDELVAKIPIEASLPAEMDDDGFVLNEPNPSFNEGLKFAVISGIEIDSSEANAGNVEAIRSALDKAKAYGASMVFAAGNTVARDNADNYAAARQFLKDTLSSTPYYVIPGSKDIKGTGSLNNFRQSFGEDFKVLDIQGTRFIMLNMATGSWRSSNGEQWNQIKRALAEASTAPSINNVVVINSLPIPNGVTLKTVSGISDAKEAEILRKMLVDFSEESGKPVAFISGQDGFRADKLDGISYISVGTDCPVISINPGADQWIQVLRNPR